MSNAPQESGQELARYLDDDTLAGITSFEDAIAVAEESGAAIYDARDLGTGYEVVDKETLVKVPLFVQSWRINQGDFGEMATLQLVTKDGRKCIVNDGSTGLKEQVKRQLSNGIVGNVLFEKGLIESSFMFCETCQSVVSRTGTCECEAGQTPKRIKATTYYLSGL